MNKYKTIFTLTLLLIAVILAIVSFEALKEKKENKAQAEVEPEMVDYSKEISDVLSKFDSLYQENILESGSVGSAVVITYKGQVAMTNCYGVQKIGNPQTIDKNTIFRLASVSKTITGVLAGKLHYENILSLDENVIDYIPELKLQTEENTSQLKVRHLLSHTTGLIPYAYDGMVEDRVPLEKIMERLNEVEITSPPGTFYSYQNVMFSLYDLVVAAKTKMSFETILKEKIFIPFGMNHASSDFKSFRNSSNKAFPHVKTKSGFKSTRLNNRYYVTLPAAGVNASISDMGRFLLALTQKEDTLFSNEERNIVFEPQVNSILKRTYYRNWDRIKSKQYAIGWRIIDYKEHTIAQHGGYISGYQSEIAICEEEEVGIAILTNSPNSNFSKNVPTFFNLFFEHKKIQQEKENQEIAMKNSSSE
jgi:beta-lactamase class C